MSRQALYRTYRPRRFADVVGQDIQVRMLREAVRQQQLTHAYLLAGPRGTGKTSVARILAQAAACAGPVEGEPCGTCASCQAAEAGAHLDIVEIDAASNRGIDEIRDLKERALHLPAMGHRKVYIVDEVHMLTEPAFNAFLKILEEPPPHVLFVFATTEPHKLPITVLSRCQRYDFHRIASPAIVKRLVSVLEQEGARFEVSAVERIADASEGGMRDALSLLDQILAGGAVTLSHVEDLLGALDESHLARLVGALLASDPRSLLEATDVAYQSGRDPRQMLRDVAQRIRDLWVWQTLGNQALEGHTKTWLQASHPNIVPRDASQWFTALDRLAEAEGRLRGTFPPRLVIELGLMKAMEALQGNLAVDSPKTTDTTTQAVTARIPERIKASPAESPTLDAEPVQDLRFAQVMDNLRRRRQLTAALFRNVTVDEEGESLVIRFTYPAHLHLLEDEATGHRQAFLDSLQEVYGPRTVKFSLKKEAEDWEDTRIRRTQALFGEDVLVRFNNRIEEG